MGLKAIIEKEGIPCLECGVRIERWRFGTTRIAPCPASTGKGWSVWSVWSIWSAGRANIEDSELGEADVGEIEEREPEARRRDEVESMSFSYPILDYRGGEKEWPSELEKRMKRRSAL